MKKYTLFISFFLISLLVTNTSGYIITVDANEETCFFDRLTLGSKMELSFEVFEGGFLDIDVKVFFLFFTFIYKRI